MDAKRMSQSTINEGISLGKYKLTGILKTGEVVLALVSDLEKEIFEKIIDLPEESAIEKINGLKVMTNSSSRELDKLYKQLTNTDKNVTREKNGLIIRK